MRCRNVKLSLREPLGCSKACTLLIIGIYAFGSGKLRCVSEQGTVRHPNINIKFPLPTDKTRNLDKSTP